MQMKSTALQQKNTPKDQASNAAMRQQHKVTLKNSVPNH